MFAKLLFAFLFCCQSQLVLSYTYLPSYPTHSKDVQLFEGMKVISSSKSDPIPPSINETYGYPDGIGGVIIEGPFPYKNGPSCWSDPDNLWGAYGLISVGGSLDDQGKCTPLPKDSPFVDTNLHPVPLNNGLNICQLGCNLTEVQQTGVDPCHLGDLTTPYSNSPMSCWDIGSMAGGYGVCAYNCTSFQVAETEKLVPCTNDDLMGGKCAVYCDSRTFPTEPQP